MTSTNSNSTRFRELAFPVAAGLALALSPLALAGCDGNGGSRKGGGPCVRGELEGCGLACEATTPCDEGLNCGSDRKCTADCTTASVALDCGTNASCSADGKCVSGDGDSGDGDGDGDNSGCASKSVSAHPTTPNVILIVDQSSSMAEDLGGVSRWQALKNVLLNNDGLISELQSQVRFGLYLYSSKNFEKDTGVKCPALTNVPAKINNLDAIRTVYQPADMIEDTPTGDAINAIVDQLGSQFNDQGGADQTIFILATDGEPDTCAQPDPQNGQQQAIAAVKRAYDASFKTFVIAVSKDNQEGISSGHAQDLANAGAGHTGAPFYRVNNVSELEDSLRQIVSGQLDCVIKLDGSFPAEVVTACDAKGTISVSGQDLTCETDWVIVDRSIIEVKGEACTNLKKPDASISASFECGGIDLF